MPTTFSSKQYGYIFEAVLLYLTQYKPFYPENIKREKQLEIWNKWFDKHRGDINELIDIVDMIVHLKPSGLGFSAYGLTGAFVDQYNKVLGQLRSGVITHYEFASQVFSELMRMRSKMALAELKNKDIESIV